MTMRSIPLRRLVLLAPHLLLTVLALSARSTVPLVAGRWSKVLFAFNVVNLAALAVAIAAATRGHVRAAVAALLTLLGLTYVGATNNDLSQSTIAVVMMIASRFGIALFFAALAVEVARSGDDRAVRTSRRLLMLGSSLLVLNLVDAAGVALFNARTAPASGVFPFRSPVDLARIEARDVVVVGDSFVWGQSVEEKQAFANRLGAALAPEGTRVHNVGLIGVGLPEYIAVLRQIPAKDTAIVCYYMNDVPARETTLTRVRQALVATGRTSFLARLASDLVGVSAFPDAAEYERAVIADYDKRDGTFATRWKLVESLIREAGAEASRNARRRPIFVILPVMVEFATYPLREAHAELAAAATASGFEVVDMLPVFTQAFPNGAAYKAGPNDNHFNAEVHAKVADVLRAALARTP